MKPFIMILLTIIASEKLFAQKNITLRFSPLALIDDVSFPTIQAGVEYFLSDRFGWYNEIGIKYRRSSYEKKADTSFASSSGIKIKAELRYYFPGDIFLPPNKKISKEKSANPYIAFNLFYTANVYNNFLQYHFRYDSTTITKDAYGANKKTYGFNFLIGNEKYFSHHFGMDFYLGLGMRLRTIKTTNMEFDNLLDDLITSRHLNMGSYNTELESRGGNSRDGNFSLGVRFFYKF